MFHDLILLQKECSFLIFCAFIQSHLSRLENRVSVDKTAEIQILKVIEQALVVWYNDT